MKVKLPQNNEDNPEHWQIEGRIIEWNKNKANKPIELSSHNISLYLQGWTLREIAEGKEIYTLNKDVPCPGIINYLPNDE